MSILFKKLGRTILLNVSRNCSSEGVAVTTKKIGRITCMGINRPKIKNCLNLEILTQLKLELDIFENDPTSFVAVLYGEQGNFSYGIDQNEISENLKKNQELLQVITGTFTKKPLIAAISGFAAGPGFELALWCDFRIVEETAVMAAYSRTFGVPLNDVTAKRLYSLVGMHRALDWVLTGRVVQAKEALDCGIATRVVACGSALGQAVNLANSLCNMPQACMKADRATLLSLSDKYSSAATKKGILEERDKYIKIALEEVKKGIHTTESGDVRRKKNS